MIITTVNKKRYFALLFVLGTLSGALLLVLTVLRSYLNNIYIPYLSLSLYHSLSLSLYHSLSLSHTHLLYFLPLVLQNFGILKKFIYFSQFQHEIQSMDFNCQCLLISIAFSHTLFTHFLCCNLFLFYFLLLQLNFSLFFVNFLRNSTNYWRKFWKQTQTTISWSKKYEWMDGWMDGETDWRCHL